MKEVSCQPLDLFFKRAEQQKIPLTSLIEGTGYPLHHFRNKHERIDWSALVRFLQNARSVWSDDELVAAGADTFRAMKPLRLVARMLFDARGFYEFVFQKQTGAGDQMFACIESSFEELPDGRLKLGMRIQEGYEFSREFFLVCKGNYTFMPTILGLPASQVAMELTSRGADYLVTLPQGGALLRNVWRKVLRPFDSRAIAVELREAHELLRSRYDELHAARAKLQEHANRLEVINRLGRDLTMRTDLDTLSVAVEKMFSENFSASCVHFFLTSSGSMAQQKQRHAGECTGAVKRALELSAAGRTIGRVEVTGGEALKDEVVEALAAWLSIAFSNALHFAELRATQAELEQRVEQRTAALTKTSAQLEDSLMKLKEADRARSEFFSNAQHELRTPLTLLLGPVEGLARDERLPAAARDELQGALRSGYRLLKLVNDLLDLSKLEAGQLRLQFTALELTHLLRETARPFGPQLRARKVELKLELPERLSLVGDAERLEQVALNLLGNAAKFTPDGGEIRVSAGEKDGEQWFCIENSGPNIAERELEKIFERFAQSSNSGLRRFGSTGLGLAVVKDLIELHGGKVKAENIENGVRFYVRLPGRGALELAPARPTMPSAQELRQYELASATEAPAAPHAREAGGGDRPLLLIAEDNADLRAYLVRNLHADFDILEAGDGEVALKLAKDRLPDLILSDLMMPGLDGIQLAAELKTLPETQSIPFVLLTARSDLQTKLSGLQKGADDYLVKPFHLDELKARLFTQLRLRQLSQRLAHREKLAALGTLVAGVAHEMRNPLNGIINSLRPIKELLSNPPEGVAELLDIAIEGCTRIDQVSAQLLRQAHPGEWTKSDVDVAENLRTSLALLSFKTLEGPKLVTDVSAAPLRIIGEAGALGQVWINLIDNAILAAGPAGQVTVTAELVDGSVTVEVADTGAGIPANIVGRIFDPFFTTRAPGSGTGLGLSFVREIVEAHGGAISVQSSPGEGARFRVTLPAAPQVQGDVRAS